jgi:alanine dehydrogenase
VYAADLVFKVKEPQPAEVERLRAGQWLFCYLHLAAVPELAGQLMERNVNAVAFETVVDAADHTPCSPPCPRSPAAWPSRPACAAWR